MLDGLEQRLAPVRFTVVHQFAEAASQVPLPHDITWLPMRRPPLTMVRSLTALTLALVPLSRRWAHQWVSRRIADPVTRQILDAYASADLVVSAPGGPYIGDLYAGHEPVHWLYARLGRAFGKPTILYAPSAGPFRRRLQAPWRRWVFNGFDVVTVREDVSAGHIRSLMGRSLVGGSLVGDGFAVEVTADSALQQVVPAASRDDDDGLLIVVSAIDLAYPDAADPDARRANHDAAVVAAVAAVVERAQGPGALKGRAVRVVLVPQLHGRRSDDAYLHRLAEAMRQRMGAGKGSGSGVAVDVLDGAVDATGQRALVASADLVIAGRYHPAVFAVGAGVPVVCIAYQHKATGVMAAAGASDLVMQVDDVTPEALTALALRVFDDRNAIAERLRSTAPALQARAARTSDLAAALVTGAGDTRAGDTQAGDPDSGDPRVGDA